jgi:hypothetical protein
MGMTKGQQYLLAGGEALRRKDFAAAEDYLLGAYQAYTTEPHRLSPDGLDPCWTVCCHLARLHRLTGRYEDSIRMLERALPVPGAFTELVSVYRFMGKAARKERDGANHAECYRKMFSLASIHATAMTLQTQNGGVDWQRAARWIEDIARQCGSIYAYQFTGEEVPNDKLLSKTDYAALKSAMS